MAKFSPIKTIESKLDSIPVTEGNFIFCTDTGNIYIDASYGNATVVRRQGFPKHIRQPVELVFEAGAQSGLNMIGDVDDPIIANTIVFVKEVEAYFYFDATSEAEPNGETIIKPEYIASGAGRWIGFTTNGITPHIDESTGNWFLGTINTGKPARGPQGYIPTIGANGNWFINDVDTGKSSKGTAPVITNGYWYLDGISSGVKAEGIDGTTPTINPSNKHWMFGSVDSGISAEGADGTVITIDPTTKNWFLDGVDSGVKAQGVDGTGFNFRGNFSSGASPSYSKTGSISDTVNYEGSLWAYINESASVNPPPSLPTTENAYWTLVLEKGSGGGGSPYYLDNIEDLNYVPARVSALEILIAGHDTESGIYSMLDTGATGTNRKWLKQTSVSEGYMLYWNSYGKTWNIDYASRWESTWEVMGGMSPIQSPANPVGEPWEITEGWIKSDEMGMGDPIPISLFMIRLPDSEELNGLAGMGSSEEPILNGSKCYVQSEKTYYEFISNSTLQESVDVIKPEYIPSGGPGRWVRSLVTGTKSEFPVTKVQIVSNKKHIDALIYIPFNNDATSIGIIQNGNLNSHFVGSSPTFVPGKFNTALRLDSSSYFDRHGVDLVTLTNNFTISIFIKFTSNNDRSIIHTEDRSNADFCIAKINNKIQLRVANGYQSYTSIDHQTNININEWYHIALTHQNGTSTLFVNGIISNTTIDELPISTEEIGIGTTDSWLLAPWGMYNRDTIYVEEFCMYDKILYTGNFNPPDQALRDQYYVTDTPQLVPIHMLEPARIGTELQAKIPFSKSISPGNIFEIGSSAIYGFSPNKRYNVFSSSNYTIIPSGFTPGVIQKTEIWEYVEAGVTTGCVVDSSYLENDYTGANEKTQGKVNIYEIRSNGAKHNMKFIVTKLSEYTPKYNLCRNSSEVVVADINNPESLIPTNDLTYAADIVDGISTKLNHYYNIKGKGRLSEPNFKYYDGMVLQMGTTLYCTFRGSGTSYKTFYNWKKVFATLNGLYNFGIYGITTDNSLTVIQYMTQRTIDSVQSWKEISVRPTAGSLASAVLYAITTDGKLYKVPDVMTYEALSVTLVDDTRNWTKFGTATPADVLFTAIADGKIFAIDSTDDTLFEVDSALGDNLIVTGCDTPNANGTYDKISDVLYSNATGYHISLIDHAGWTMYDNRWVLANTADFSEVEDEWMLEMMLTAQKSSVGGTPTDGTWSGQMGMSANMTVTVANAVWSDVVGSVKPYGENASVLAVKKDGTCHYIKWDVPNENLVSAPIEIDGVPDTETGWIIKQKLNTVILKNNTLYKINWDSTKPTIDSASAIQKVVNYGRSYSVYHPPNTNYYVTCIIDNDL